MFKSLMFIYHFPLSLISEYVTEEEGEEGDFEEEDEDDDDDDDEGTFLNCGLEHAESCINYRICRR